MMRRSSTALQPEIAVLRMMGGVVTQEIVVAGEGGGIGSRATTGFGGRLQPPTSAQAARQKAVAGARMKKVRRKRPATLPQVAVLRQACWATRVANAQKCCRNAMPARLKLQSRARTCRSGGPLPSPAKNPMRIATWNVNSVKQRLPHLLKVLSEVKPDVLCLQELKCLEEAFPRLEVEEAGYNVNVCGQKAFNGVAILSKQPLEDVRRGLPGEDGDDQARYIEGAVSTAEGVVRVASIYLPNGNPIGTPKFAYKLAWMDRLIAHARGLLALEEPLVLAGDFNVIPEPRDARHPEHWTTDALFQPESRAKFRELLSLGLTDAVRACDDGPGPYTFWDYKAGAFQRNDGIRIDHLALSPEAADRLRGATVHKVTRTWEKPSDHVPVSVDLDIA